MKKVLVVGSINMDVVIRVPHIPQPGETILAHDIKNYGGGKGANQAIAAARLEGNVSMIGRLGNDTYGRELHESLKSSGIDTKGIIFSDNAPTGTAYIYVDDDGRNCITVCQGANKLLCISDIKQNQGMFENVEFCVIQLEIPLEVVKFVVELCYEKNIKVILNPAPACKLPDDMLKKIYLLTPNETELAFFSSKSTDSIKDIEEASELLVAKGVKNVITTIGERGSLLVNSNIKRLFNAVKVTPVDTTAAGDCFTGALSVALSRNDSIESAIQFATYASAIAVTREGAQSSLPTGREIEMFVKELDKKG